MASNSSRNISTAPAGSVTPSLRYFSALQSNSTNSSGRLAGAATAFSTFTDSGVTSAPIPLPGITAMRAAGPPFRKGIPANALPPRRQIFRLLDEPGTPKDRALFFHQSAVRATRTQLRHYAMLGLTHF